MKKLTLVIMGITLFLHSCKNGSPPAFDIRFQNVREKVIHLIKDGKVASMSIAVAKDGKILWEESFGWADLKKKVCATPHTKYLSASIAKTITATGLMTLVEKGLVDLDKPIIDYVPHLKIRSFVGEEKEITVRHILNHRSGMPSYCELFFEGDPEEIRDFPETVRRYGIIAFPPGGPFIYSNLSYELIASLISEVSGLDYSRYIEKNAFLPLRMMDSKVLTQGRTIDQTAICYTPDFNPIPRYWGCYPGSDGIYISAHDLIRFAMFHLKDHLQDQKAILSDETIDKMQEAYPPSNTRYGIGWAFDINEAGYRSVHHGGEGPGSDHFMRLIPSEDMALVILCNTEIGRHLSEIQEEICTALIPGFAKVGKEDQLSDESAEEQEIPKGLFGKWKGKIVAYDREIETELIINNTEGAKISLSGQQDSKIDLAVVTDDFLLGYFSGVVPTPDAQRHPDKIRLALIRQGNRLSGSATADQWIEERQMRYELSSWIELSKM
jgi:CubicO group peptidase (beta-lactamase class C family)